MRTIYLDQHYLYKHHLSSDQAMDLLSDLNNKTCCIKDLKKVNNTVIITFDEYATQSLLHLEY